MKPSCQIALRLLQQHDSVTTHDLLVSGVGSRYSARIHELRHEHGYVITEERLKGDRSGSRYRLIAGPELAAKSGLATHHREGDEALTAGAASTLARGCPGTHSAAVSRDGDGQAGRASGAQLTGPCRVDNANPAGAESPHAAVPPAGSRTAGVLFDPDAFGRAA